MISVHVYVDDKMITNRVMQHCPRVNDILRFGVDNDRYAKVTEVIWCLNEGSKWLHPGTTTSDRVNIRAVEEK